jgi:glycosyltransferase involved in cell wall biosynthesis
MDRVMGDRQPGSTKKLRVLFIVPDPEVTPPISVHADLMRFLRRDRVAVYAVYPRLAERDPWRSSPASVLKVLPRAPHAELWPVELGPARGAGRAELAAAALPAMRDGLNLVRYVRRNRIDIIHCDYRVVNAFAGYLLSRMTQARYLIHMHSNYGSWLKPPSVFAFARADAIVTVSQWVARTVAERGGIPKERIYPVLNGIDASKWDPSVSGAAVRHELGLSPEDPLIAQVAQLVHWKRQDVVIRAFRAVAARYPGARLLLAGKETVTGYEAQLRRQVAEAGLTRHVVFAGHRQETDRVFAATDIPVLASQADPCPLVIAEAMAMAKPIVSVRSGGIPEMVEHGKGGLLGKLDDADELAANILRLLEDDALRSKMGQHGRERVLDYLNAQRMADDVEAVYRRLSRRGSVSAGQPGGVEVSGEMAPV